jgi:hypothetical protein
VPFESKWPGVLHNGLPGIDAQVPLKVVCRLARPLALSGAQAGKDKTRDGGETS